MTGFMEPSAYTVGRRPGAEGIAVMRDWSAAKPRLYGELSVGVGDGL